MRRHDWVYLHPGAPLALGACPLSVREWIEEWVMDGGALVATRQSVPAGRVALGVVVPARLGRVRVGCTVATDDVARVRGPVTIAEAAHVLPTSVGRVLASLQQELARQDVRIAVFGSTAWSCMTGEAYRHAASDVDVVCDLADTSHVEACLGALHSAADALEGTLDGEIRFPCGRAVAWRELAAARRDGLPVVLAKGMRDVGMAAIGDLLATAA